MFFIYLDTTQVHNIIIISQKVQEVLSKYDVSTDQVSVVVHDEAVNAV